jgi:hypothetical protein
MAKAMATALLAALVGVTAVSCGTTSDDRRSPRGSSSAGSSSDPCAGMTGAARQVCLAQHGKGTTQNR